MRFMLPTSRRALPEVRRQRFCPWLPLKPVLACLKDCSDSMKPDVPVLPAPPMPITPIPINRLRLLIRSDTGAITPGPPPTCLDRGRAACRETIDDGGPTPCPPLELPSVSARLSISVVTKVRLISGVTTGA